MEIKKIQKSLNDFAIARDWLQFHSPKNLSMALACESGELLEIFRWLTEQESHDIKNNLSLKQKVSHELADVLLNAIRIADLLEINLEEAITAKMTINEEKYPQDIVKGCAKKYDEY